MAKKKRTSSHQPRKKILNVVQKDPEMAPRNPQQIYSEREIMGDFSRFSEILRKIKYELKISSFLELANHFEKLLEDMMKQKDIARKGLVFMDGISRISSATNTENQENSN